MYKKFFKRFLDIFCCLMVFIFLWPIYLVVAIVVRAKMGKGIIFKQARPGKDGKIFYLYKFRSMLNSIYKNGNPLSDEERLTSFGKKLRESSLDELPEVINILKGDMSIIGPRPQLVKDMVFFDEETMKRQSVRPGLSGLAQVEGRNNVTWEQKFEYDLEYVKKITFCNDFKLVWKSFIKAFIKQDDIETDGMATAEDYGDYLLRTGKITKDYYDSKCLLAKELVEKNEKK